MFAEVLEPGLVLLRGFLGVRVQQRLFTAAMRLGLRPDGRGFWDRERTTGDYSGGPETTLAALSSSRPQRGPSTFSLNSTPSRGRIYDALGNFPPAFAASCRRAVNLARQADPEGLPSMPTPSHMIALYYEGNEGMGWHRDVYENDGEHCSFPYV